MSKIHLRANKLTDTNVARAVCASKSSGNGMNRPNSRKTYEFMASEIVGIQEFKDVPMADRCAHCVDMGLAMRNRQRKAKGLAPVTHIDEKI